MIAVDSSVAIAAFGEWHQLNTKACAVLDRGASLPAHALLETYSVLTAFPAPYRASPDLVATWLANRFPQVLPAPPPNEYLALVQVLAAAGRVGGSVYDGLIGLTAKLAGATLVTADERALPIYEAVEVRTRRLS